MIQRRSFIAAPLVIAAAIGLAISPATAHEDDPKILDRRPAVKGTGFRRAAPAQSRSLTGAAEFPAQGIRLESWLTLGDLGSEDDTGNDCWGYVSPSGREYALIGTARATVVVEITTPSNAQVVERLPGPSSLWRDIKVYQDRAYAVSEGGSGIQVFDLSQVDSGVVTLENTITGQGSNATHNVAIDEVSGFLYRAGGSGNGLRIYSLANPSSPQFVGSYGSRYVHDVQVVTYTTGPYAGRQLAFCCAGFNNGFGDTGLTILDVTNKNNIQTLSQVGYPGREYSHQGWLSADRTRFYLGDELDQRNGINLTVTRVIDVSDPGNATYLGDFDNGVNSISHNMYERDGYLFQANYTSGLRVFDLNVDPNSPPEVAWIDTAPNLTAGSFNGLWSCFPNFPSGTVIGSDLERGLFVMTFDPLSVDAQAAQLDALAPAGESVTVQIDEISPGTLNGASPRLVVDGGNGTIEIPLTAAGAAGQYTALLPSFPCGTEVEWYVSATTMTGVESTYPEAAPTSPFVSIVGETVTDVRVDRMQDDAGWVGGAPGDTAIRGAWVRNIPVGTDAEPDADNSAGGRFCWFTGRETLDNNTAGDVDRGFTTLLTPIFDMSALSFPTVEYYRWYSNDVGPSIPDDAFLVEISNDAGATWQTLESVGPTGPGTSAGWCRASFLVAETLPPTSEMQLRFIATDVGIANIVEAAIDDFRIRDAGCGAPIGTAYCMAATNSSGSVGEIEAFGSDFISLNNLQLVASGLPTGQSGFYVCSRDQAFVPNIGGGQGTLCVGASTGRYLTQVGNTGTLGQLTLAVDVNAIPQPVGTVPVLPGDTWNFQCWHRDQNPGPTSNMSRGYSVTFR